MIAEHTPGPWIVDGNVIRGDEQRNGSVSVACVLDVAYPYGRRAGESAQANARLIAAAPELLAALRGMLAIVNDSRGVAGYHLNGNTAEWDEFDEVDAARAAIAKVEGGAA